jgi:hypothetical protein
MVNGDRQLAQARLAPAVSAEQDAPAGTVVAADQWVIVINSSGDPTAALPPGEVSRAAPVTPLRDLVRRLRGFIVADARSTFSAVLDLADELADETESEPTVVVVVDLGRVRGVSTAAELRNQLFRIRYANRGVALPGPITLPKLVRYCQYRENDELCGWTQRFAKRPLHMPPCGNPRKLSDHLFVW